MSASELQQRLGIQVSARQFRRYLAEGLIPADWITRTARGYLTFARQKREVLDKVRQEIDQWKEGSHVRGWNKRGRRPVVKLKQNLRGRISLESIHLDFKRWRLRQNDEGFPHAWSQAQHSEFLDLLEPMRQMGEESHSALQRARKSAGLLAPQSPATGSPLGGNTKPPAPDFSKAGGATNLN